jgi:hypothetical protein
MPKFMKSKYSENSFLHIVGWLAVFISLFSYLQVKALYNLYFMEQWQIFLYDWPHIFSVLWQPGGLAQLTSDYLVQFFTSPYCGALILAFILTLIGLFTDLILKRLAPASHLSIIGLLPVVSILFLQLNVNYQLAGTVAFLLFTIGLNLYLRIGSELARVIFASCSSLIIYFLAGPIASLFAICVLLIELFLRIKRSYFFLIPLAVVCLSAITSLHLGVAGEFKHLLLPDGYFNLSLKAGNIIYQPWGLMLAIILFSLLLHSAKSLKKKILTASLTFQLIALGCFAYFSMSSMIDPRYEFFKELDYDMRTENWDKILQRCQKTTMNNYLYQNCQNVALAEKGKLAECLFDYPQQGLQSIYLKWDNTPYISVLLSDVYFSMGHIAMSQRMAFESNVSGNNYNPRMLKRLVQTNLIYGAYRVAEKYIAVLEKTKYYAEWAHSQRRFLDNDTAVKSDPLLGIKRGCLFPENCLSGKNGIDSDLKHIIDHNPLHRATIQYLGSIYLLINDIPKFKSMVENFYGTSALPSLPKAFQEGVMRYAADDVAALKHYRISDQVVREYSEFRTRKTGSTNTFWSYLSHYKGN